MKAPDKIYLHPDDRHWWHEGNKTDDRFVEYIRKDALMEWVRKDTLYDTRGYHICEKNELTTCRRRNEK